MASGVEARLAATEYQREAVRFAGKYAGYYSELGRLWRAGRMSDTQYVRLCVELERAGHDGSASLAARFVSDFRRLNGVDPGLIVYDEFDAAAAWLGLFRPRRFLRVTRIGRMTRLMRWRRVLIGLL